MPHLSNAEVYEQIRYQSLERNGFPTNYIELTVDQKAFIDEAFHAAANSLSVSAKMQDVIYELEDKVADLQHELNSLAGEK